MGDELTNLITHTQQKIITAINESGLHPMILQMMLNDIQHQLADTLRASPTIQSDNVQGEKKNE
jgi:hypothetical protein